MGMKAWKLAILSSSEESRLWWNDGGMISVFGVMIFLFYLAAFADVSMSVCRRRQQTNGREYFIVYLGESMIQKKASQW